MGSNIVKKFKEYQAEHIDDQNYLHIDAFITGSDEATLVAMIDLDSMKLIYTDNIWAFNEGIKKFIADQYVHHFWNTPKLDKASKNDGWMLVNTEGSEGGDWQVQRVDDMTTPVFNDDKEVWYFIKNTDCLSCKTVIKLLEKINPQEHQNIVTSISNEKEIELAEPIESENTFIIIGSGGNGMSAIVSEVMRQKNIPVVVMDIETHKGKLIEEIQKKYDPNMLIKIPKNK